LDPLTAPVLDKLIHELTHEYQMTTIVVSHDMNSVTNFGDKIMLPSNKTKAWEGDINPIMNSDNPGLNKFEFVSKFMKQKKYESKPTT
jgi:phospholipid/cholesterol/gamma-HCH transport system ATP-binding protein